MFLFHLVHSQFGQTTRKKFSPFSYSSRKTTCHFISFSADLGQCCKYAPNYTLYRETCFIHLVGRRLATVRAPNASIFCIPRLIWSSGLEIAIFVPKYIAYIVVCCVCVVLMLITSPTARASSQQQIQQTITQHKT